MISFLLFLIASLTSGIVTFFGTPIIIRFCKKNRIVGIDKNKYTKYEVPRIGGIAIIFGYITAILIEIAYFRLDQDMLFKLFAALFSILLVAFIGLIDDIFDIRQDVKVILPIFASLPLVVTRVGNTVVGIPFFRAIDFGIFYSILLVPLAFSAASNMPNILAGFNGLEAGMMLITTVFLTLCAVIAERTVVILLLLPLIPSLLAFLKYNFYPAKTFPGNVATYFLGATPAAAVIVGNMERAGVIVFLPYLVEFFIKARSRFKAQSFAYEVTPEGLLVPPKKAKSLTHYVMKLRPMTEKQLVLVFYFISLVFGCIALFDVIRWCIFKVGC